VLNKAMLDAMNEQIKQEFSSAYHYLAMLAHCEAVNLPGFAHWLRLQSQEEASHALKYFDFVQDRGGRVALKAIEQPPAELNSPFEVFQQVLDQERKVTGMIHQLYELAVKENDYASQAFLQWFITEQIEEEKQASRIVEQLKMIGEAPAGLLMLDRQLAARSDG